MRNRYLWAATGTAAILLLSGCSTSAGTAESELDIEVVDELAALVPDSFRDAGAITVGINADNPPVKFVGEDGEFTGMAVEQLQAAGALLDLDINFEAGSFDSLIPGLESGTYDALVSIGDLEERHEKATFIDYLNSGTAYVANPESGITVTDHMDLCGYAIGYVRGTGQQKTTEADTLACEAAGVEPLTSVGYADANAALLAVSSGEDDLAFIDSPPAAYNAANSPDKYEVVLSEYTDPLGVAFKAGEDELVDAFRQALLQLVEDGTYAELGDKWGITDDLLTDFPINNGL